MGKPNPHKILLFLWFGFLLALNYIIPYTVLKDYNKLLGAYIFWPILTIVVALSCFILVNRWGKISG